MLLFQRCRTWSMSRTILVRVQRTFQPIVKSVQHEDWCSSWQAELDQLGVKACFRERDPATEMVSSECSIVVGSRQRRGQCSRVGLVD